MVYIVKYDLTGKALKGSRQYLTWRAENTQEDDKVTCHHNFRFHRNDAGVNVMRFYVKSRLR